MSKKQQKIVWAGLFAALIPSVFAFGLAWPNSEAASAKRIAVTNPTQRQVTPALFTPRIRIWIHGDDVHPHAIHAWPGKAMLTLENETHADISLQIEGPLPNLTQLVGAVNLSARSKRLQREIILSAGEYVFYESSRPTIRGRLIVEPR